jgi:hypothetical protein
MLEEEHAREAARAAAEQAAEHAARLEPGLAAGCGVCGILRYKGEALMQLHERSGRHNRAVARAAQAAEVAEEAVVAAEIAVSSNGDVNAVDKVSSTDLNGDGEEPNEVDERAAVTAATADRNTWPYLPCSTVTEDHAHSNEPLDAPETHLNVAPESMNAILFQGSVQTDADTPEWQTTEESPGAQTFGYSLDDVYRSLGYSRIDSLVRILRCEYAEGKDFTTVRLQPRSTGPGPVKYWITHRCLAIMTARIARCCRVAWRNHTESHQSLCVKGRVHNWVHGRSAKALIVKLNLGLEDRSGRTSSYREHDSSSSVMSPGTSSTTTCMSPHEMPLSDELVSGLIGTTRTRRVSIWLQHWVRSLAL